jgi:hypothetical protein
MITPEVILMEKEQGRVFQIELGMSSRVLAEGKSESDVEKCKEEGTEVP